MYEFGGVKLTQPCPRQQPLKYGDYCITCGYSNYRSDEPQPHGYVLSEDGGKLITFIKEFGNFADADHGHSF